MWRRHVVYESQPHGIIVTLGGQLYKIPEVVLNTVLTKKCHKVISHTTKFILFTICSKEKETTITATLDQDPYIQQNKINKII
jgi:hypothetical protein